MIRVLVLDRDRATCEALATGLAAAEDMEAVATALSAEEALEVIDREEVDTVVASANLRADAVLDLARTLRGREERPCLVVTGIAASDAVLLRYLEAGVDAYLTEELSMSGLLLVLRLLDRGEVLMSPRTSRRLVERLHAMADLLEESGVDLAGLSKLTPREEEVLGLLGDELTNKQIAERLFIGVGTVKTHVHSILDKLEVRDRDEARKVLVLSRVRAREEERG